MSTNPKASGLMSFGPGTAEKYDLWLNYDNDRKSYIFPVTPEKIIVSCNGINTSIKIDKLGEIFHKGKREATTISWSSYFPKKYSAQYCVCGKKHFHAPRTMHRWILSLMNAENPAHFVLTGGPLAIDMYVLIKSYKAHEEGGDVGTISYTIELKEYRCVEVTRITVPKKKVATTKKRVNNSENERVYTVRSGDTLRKIAKKFYGHKHKWKKIYNANRAVIHKTAKAHGHRTSHQGKYIYPGEKLVIP